MPKDQVAKELSPLEELEALYPSTGKILVKDPRDRSPERQTIHVQMRALSMREIKAMIGEAMLIAEDVQNDKRPAEIVNDHGDEVLKLAAVATDRDADWLLDLDGGDFVRIVKGFVGANADFFFELGDLLYGKAGTVMGRVLRGVGQTPSRSSPGTDSSTP